MGAARQVGRYGHRRDATLILIVYRHGLRAVELVALCWDQVDLGQGLQHVARLKNGMPSTISPAGPETRALRLQRECPDCPLCVHDRAQGSAHHLSRAQDGGASPRMLAGLSFPVHPHMLHYATGFKLANDGHDTRAIQYTTWDTGTSSTPCATRSWPQNPAQGFLEGLTLPGPPCVTP